MPGFAPTDCLDVRNSVYQGINKEAEGESKEGVVKLLYNYYASSTDQDGQSLSTSPDQWTLLHEQRHREVNLRPPGRHPNIVPILRDFFDRVPSSGKETTLERVEDFPEDLVKGKWKPIGTLSPSTDSVSSPTRQEVKNKELEKTAVEISVPSSPTFSLPLEEAIGVTVQMIEAVAELERCHTAHRDIKPSNFLIKSRSLSSRSNLLNVEIAKLANTRLQVALTDFGCAIRTDTALTDGNILSHSGNTSLWAPEVAEYFAKQNQWSKNSNTTAVYKRSDLWATATIVYQLFGEENPFLSGSGDSKEAFDTIVIVTAYLSPYYYYSLSSVAAITSSQMSGPFDTLHYYSAFQKLTSKDYTESQLPEVPAKAPTVLGWLLRACLRRDPSFRPPARLVADVLHTWCLLQLLKRILPYDLYKDAVPRIPLPAELLADKFINSAKSSKNIKEVFIAIEMQAMAFARRLRRRNRWLQHVDDSLRESLRRLLELLWTIDLLLGPAKASLGIRSLFYQRITLEQFAYCLAFVQLAENRPLIYSSDLF
ncbi:hypothetical protein ACTXT7_006020 [Hymenolepis weldensis]